MAKNLFEKAKKVSSKKVKNENPHIKIEDSTFFEKVEKLEELNLSLKKLKVSADIISDELRELGRSEWSKLYLDIESNPGTVILEQENEFGDVGQFQLVPSDKYINIDIKKAETMRKKYGDDIVQEKTVYSIDNSMIEKYGEVLSKLIEESTEIKEEDKDKIIKAEESYSIAKGTIDKMISYNKNINMIVEEIKPVFSIKNIEVIKG
jgi:hypothetical protein